VKISSTTYQTHNGYELSDHLRNIRVVLTDKRVSTYTSGFLTSVSTDISSWSDYFSFGWEIPGRHVDLPNSRYTFNGKELDREWDRVDFDFRPYNRKTARFEVLDFKQAFSPNISNYLYAGNSPISFIDVLGLAKGKPELIRGARGIEILNTKVSLGFQAGYKAFNILSISASLLEFDMLGYTFWKYKDEEKWKPIPYMIFLNQTLYHQGFSLQALGTGISYDVGMNFNGSTRESGTAQFLYYGFVEAVIDGQNVSIYAATKTDVAYRMGIGVEASLIYGEVYGKWDASIPGVRPFDEVSQNWFNVNRPPLYSYSVQVGAFKDKGNAIKQRDRFSGARIVEDNGTFKVQLSSDNENDAELLLNAVRKDAPDAFIVKTVQTDITTNASE